MASKNISLPNAMLAWIEQRIESGQYASVSDYTRDLIRRDQIHADVREAVTTTVIKGEKSGISKRRIPEILAAVKRESQRQGG